VPFRYDLAKSILKKDILPWIRTSEPNLTDHGPDHIENVLNNAYKLIEPTINHLLSCDVTIDKPIFSHLDLYFLCQAILFHDVGNLFGRNKHNQTAYKVINEKFSKYWYPKKAT
jgi:metal-dependent HD superfamily phosphatase/phosphodiesterase